MGIKSLSNLLLVVFCFPALVHAGDNLAVMQNEASAAQERDYTRYYQGAAVADILGVSVIEAAKRKEVKNLFETGFAEEVQTKKNVIEKAKSTIANRQTEIDILSDTYSGKGKVEQIKTLKESLEKNVEGLKKELAQARSLVSPNVEIEGGDVLARADQHVIARKKVQNLEKKIAAEEKRLSSVKHTYEIVSSDAAMAKKTEELTRDIAKANEVLREAEALDYKNLKALRKKYDDLVSAVNSFPNQNSSEYATLAKEMKIAKDNLKKGENLVKTAERNIAGEYSYLFRVTKPLLAVGGVYLFWTIGGDLLDTHNEKDLSVVTDTLQKNIPSNQNAKQGQLPSRSAYNAE